ncbi:deoxyguanosinetriphosphate triphosphohydrolase-like protein [Enhygromyxa salina]|uniref:Deoxyguanosinetriphosphate triphosphohydrolase-like protein n=1 Tax=Enhygromyxa salina TaxID=215803 RepID=A0A2S9XU79_9BACT|nr:deoxyguanosinetriphosphate triphosphohydrolase-like protein [Enhygromyxa salina]
MTEKELHRLCREQGLDAGYEGNAQSFRILAKLAVRSENYAGLNLSRATLNAVLKYPWQYASIGKHRKKWGAYPEEKDDFEFARRNTHSDRTLEAELMNFADDVAYSIHDAEDFYRAGLIPMEFLVSDGPEIDRVIKRVQERTGFTQQQLVVAWESALPFAFDRRYTGTATHRSAVRSWTSQMIQRYVQAVDVSVNDGRPAFTVPANIRHEIELLKGLTWEYVIESPTLATQQMGHRKIIRGLFEAYLEAVSTRPAVLPPRFQDYLSGALADQVYGPLDQKQRQVRTVADIIANMTDTEALRMYRRLHGFSPGSLAEIAPM